MPITTHNGVLTKLGRQTGYFSCNENFSLDFSFSVTRPKTKNAKLSIRYC
jgi:hypothetical protein